MKHLAIYLYLNRMTIRGIARTLNVSAPSVLKWIKEKAIELPEAQEKRYIPEVEVSEMWHYLETKKKNCGSSRRLIVLQENCSLLRVGIAP
ncbi:MAG: helix-turn-helix domain-containing protein [Vampirovibrio sp.]